MSRFPKLPQDEETPMRYDLPILPKALLGLADLALDLRWSWSHSSDELWQLIDPDMWEVSRNPTYMLQAVPRTRLEQLAHDPDFLSLLIQHLSSRREILEAESWFAKKYKAGNRPGTIAYLSMEFGLAEALPIYSGGLGILAGDFLKTASDLGVPMVGVGILWQQGYFRQMLDSSGAQLEVFPYNDPGQLPVMPLRDDRGQWMTITLALPNRTVRIRPWEVTAGRVKLYLLDTNDLFNSPADRGITSDLYGGGPELRLQQEIVLGIGGWRLLRELGIQADVCHLNEGHAAFAVLERARGLMEDRGLDFEVALMASRPGNLFTTHTSVEAGFDRFSPRLIEQYLGEYAQKELGIGVDKLLTLGRAPAGDGGAEEERVVSPDEPFNMAYLAIHGSGAVNAVSRLHGEVSRRLFQPLFPRRPEYEVPVGHVTNGVHIPSWDSAKADELWTKYCGKKRWLDGVEGLAEGIRQASDEEIWELRQSSRRRLIADARIHVQQQGPIAGSLESLAQDVSNVCHPDILTLGFARRFTGYKRVNLLLHDPDRLERLLCGLDSRVQLVFAGKAHPADTEGKAAIKQWTDFIRRCDVRRHALFLVDYDMDVADHLVHGVDVWINTPRRPWEASGTSGMKILVNGGLNLSELDGWWAEGYSPEVGWALGDGLEHDGDPAWDAKEAEDLYNLIENVIVPEFYDRDEKGIPRKWVARVRESMARLTPQYSANRMLEEYLEGSYLPASAAFHRRMAFRTTAEGETIAAGYAVDLEAWRRTLEEHWDEMSFKKYSIEPAVAGVAGDSEATYSVRVEVELGGMPHGAVRVELFAEPVIPMPGEETHHKGELPLPEIYICSSEECGLEQDGGSSTRVYCAEFSTARPPQDFTPRVVPHHPEARIPMEANYVLWFR